MNEPLLLLPGMMCDARLFAPQSGKFSTRRSVIIGSLSRHDNFTDMAAHILEMAPPKFALAGLSMGGIAAMEIMRLEPNRVTRLALIDTNHLADTPERRKQRDRQISQVQAGGLYGIMRDEMKPNYLADSPNRANILNLCMDMAKKLGPDVFIRQSKALQMRRDQTDVLTHIKTPTLIMCGREDTLCPVETHEIMHTLISGSELSIVEGAGHLPVLEKPEFVNQLLEHWLNRLV